MPPLLTEAHAPHSQSETEGGEAMMGGLCRLVMWAGCEGLVVRVVWAGCVCCKPLQYLFSCEAHLHKCATKMATNGILMIARKLSMRQKELLHLIKANQKDLRRN
jgi:hypothetical protein